MRVYKNSFSDKAWRCKMVVWYSSLQPRPIKVKVRLSLCLSEHHAIKTHWGVDVWLHAFLTLALDGGEWLASSSGLFTTNERDSGTHWIGGWLNLRDGLDAVALCALYLIVCTGIFGRNMNCVDRKTVAVCWRVRLKFIASALSSRARCFITSRMDTAPSHRAAMQHVSRM